MRDGLDSMYCTLRHTGWWLVAAALLLALCVVAFAAGAAAVLAKWTGG